MPSTQEYNTKYKKEHRAFQNGDREDLLEEKFQIKFNSKNISISQFKKHYKEKIENKEQEFIFNNCITLIDLILSDKSCLESEGAYVKNVTGTLKVNPATKELRENLKAFNSQLALLHTLLNTDKEEDLDGWLNG
ncbi:hypothetical protein [Clostridium sp. BL-8]|uniref:hypothetical protein n=1 Tax=Clostridium sp. BL-8 TaxID=349938 RepID=UPI00098CE27B|nr:hypothetical protein [Clostridium sp. BL-8]OOM76586.1 hypothetical protein CLOBL_34710 [Clostridium sp. BL-8]